MDDAAATASTETVTLNATGAATTLPTADAAALVTAGLAKAAEPETAAPLWIKTLVDIDGVARSGRVVQAPAAKAQPWIDASEAALATETDIAISAPFHTILED